MLATVQLSAIAARNVRGERRESRGGGAGLQVSALLRHTRLDTTLIYAKVDPALLQTVAQPWPLPVAP